MLRSSLIFSALTLFSRVFGLMRDLVVNFRLGDTAAADAYNTMLSFPNLFRRIFAEGAFTAGFVPAYSRKLTADGEAEADRMASDALATLAAVTIVFTLLCQLAMPWLMYAINPGYADDPVKFKLAVTLTQISMPYLPCMAIAALFTGALNARGRFIVSGAFPVILNLVMIATIWPQKDPVDAAWAASWGVVVAGVLQAAVCWWGAARCGARIRLVRPKLTPEIKALILLAGPAAFAASATQINVFVSQALASRVDGARTWLANADRFYQLPLGLVGVAIGVALLPKLSQALQAGDHDEAQASMDQAVVFSMALTLPAAAAMMAIPFFLFDGLFTRGQYTVEASAATAQALFHFGWATPAFVLNRILQPAFFARQDTKAPMRYALVSVVVNVVLALGLFQVMGVPGIAAAIAAASWVNVLQMAWALSKRDLYRPSAKAWSKLLRVTLASALLGVLLKFAEHFRPAIEGLMFGYKEMAVIAVAALAVLVYPVLVMMLGGLTPAEIKAALRRPKKAPPPPPDLL